MFVESSVTKSCKEYERVSKSVKFLMEEKKILSLRIVWNGEKEDKLKQTFFVSKCISAFFIECLENNSGISALTTSVFSWTFFDPMRIGICANL